MRIVRSNFPHKLIFLLLVLTIGAGNVQAQFQPMRLLSGIFRIGGEVASNLPAACVESTARTPTRMDHYSMGTGDITVARFEGTREVETRPLNDVLDKWIRIVGTNSATSVRVEPVTRQANISYEIRVDKNKPAVLGSASQLNSLADVLNRHQKALQVLDDFGNELRAIVPKEDGLINRFFEKKEVVEWAIVEALDANESLGIANDFIDHFKASVRSDDTPAKRLERLSVLNGSALSKEQISKLSLLLEVPIDEKYTQQFEQDLATYSATRQKLRTEFGDSYDFLEGFESDVVAHYELKIEPDLSGAMNAAREGLLRDFQQDGKTSSDLISLYYGKKLTENQRVLLESISGAKVSAFSGKLDDHVLISTSERGGDLRINTTNSSKVVQFSEFTKLHLDNHKRVVIDGPISDQFAAKLRAGGVTVVRSVDSLLQPPKNDTNQVKLIFVTSENATIARQIFEGQNVASVLRATSKAKTIPNSVIARNRAELDSALASVKPGERAMVVFHDSEDGIIVDRPISLEEVGDKADLLSCNTYRFKFIDYPSVQRLDFEVVVDALAATQAKQRGKPGTFDEFMYTFNDNYERQSMLRRLYRKVLLVGSAVGTTGIGYFIYTIASSLSEDAQPRQEPNALQYDRSKLSMNEHKREEREKTRRGE